MGIADNKVMDLEEPEKNGQGETKGLFGSLF